MIGGTGSRWHSPTRGARRFAAALGLLAKTDTIDTEALAAYGTAFLDMPATPPRSQFLDQFAGLLVPREARYWASGPQRLLRHPMHHVERGEHLPGRVRVVDRLRVLTQACDRCREVVRDGWLRVAITTG